MSGQTIKTNCKKWNSTLLQPSVWSLTTFPQLSFSYKTHITTFSINCATYFYYNTVLVYRFLKGRLCENCSTHQCEKIILMDVYFATFFLSAISENKFVRRNGLKSWGSTASMVKVSQTDEHSKAKRHSPTPQNWVLYCETAPFPTLSPTNLLWVIEQSDPMPSGSRQQMICTLMGGAVLLLEFFKLLLEIFSES